MEEVTMCNKIKWTFETKVCVCFFSAEGSFQWTEIQKSKPSKDPDWPLSLAYLSGMNRSLGPTVRGLAWLTRILRPAIVSPSAPEAASWVQKSLIIYFFEKDIICMKYFYKSMFYLGICPVTKDYEGVERGIAGQPDLLQRTVPDAERFITYLTTCRRGPLDLLFNFAMTFVFIFSQ